MEREDRIITSESGRATEAAQNERSRRLREQIQANPNPRAGEPQTLRQRLIKVYESQGDRRSASSPIDPHNLLKERLRR